MFLHACTCMHAANSPTAATSYHWPAASSKAATAMSGCAARGGQAHCLPPAWRTPHISPCHTMHLTVWKKQSIPPAHLRACSLLVHAPTAVHNIQFSSSPTPPHHPFHTDMEMEVTFLPGLENLGERLLAKKREEEARKGETVWDAYMRRKR